MCAPFRVAAVCRKAGEPLVMEEVMVAPPFAGEVRIRIICTSLCYSDITFWKLKVRFTFAFLPSGCKMKKILMFACLVLDCYWVLLAGPASMLSENTGA